MISDRVHKSRGLRGRAMLLGGTIFCEGLALMLFSQMRVLTLAVGAMMLTGLFIKMSNGASYAVVPFVNRKALGAVAGIVGRRRECGSCFWRASCSKGAMALDHRRCSSWARRYRSFRSSRSWFASLRPKSTPRSAENRGPAFRARWSPGGSDGRLAMKKNSCFSHGWWLRATRVAQTAAAPANTPIKLGDVTFTASLRAREYVWDWFQTTGAYENQYAYSGDLLRLNFAQTRGKFLMGTLKIAVPFLLDMPKKCDRAAGPPGEGLGLGSNYFHGECEPAVCGDGICENNCTVSIASGRRNRRVFRSGALNSTMAQNLRRRMRRSLFSSAIASASASSETFGFSDVGRSF